MTVGSSSDDFEVAAYFGARPSASTPGEAAEGTCVGDACCYYPSSTPWGYGTLSAGTVSVTDGASTLVALDPADASAGYATVTSPAWRPGDVLSVSATGGEIASFVGLVAVPEPILFASPAAWDATALSTSADLTFSWTPVPDERTSAHESTIEHRGNPDLGNSLGERGALVRQSRRTRGVPSRNSDP
jgi:hypothetical protein